MPILIEKPADNDVCKLADWMEINSLLDPDSNTSKQELTALLSNGSLDESEEDQIEDSASEQLAQDVLNELSYRLDACGGQYPFRLDGELITAKDDVLDYMPYIYCLLISFFGIRNSIFPWTYHVITKEFENLCVYAVKGLYSTYTMPATAHAFGFPRKEDGFSGTAFLDALKKICKDSGQMEVINEHAAKSRMDAGLDVICWKNFPDGLRGGLLFWGQCATGDNWNDKLHDIAEFKGYVRVPSSYTTGVFMPHMVETASQIGKEQWDVWTIYSGSIFNRCRISHLAAGWDNADIKRFCETTLTALKSN